MDDLDVPPELDRRRNCTRRPIPRFTITARRTAEMSQKPSQRRRDRGVALQGAFLQALEGRVARDPGGRVVLPVGPVDVTELAQVVRALKCARQQPRKEIVDRRQTRRSSPANEVTIDGQGAAILPEPDVDVACRLVAGELTVAQAIEILAARREMEGR